MIPVVTTSLPGQAIGLWCICGGLRKCVAEPEDSGQLVAMNASLNNATHYLCSFYG